MAVIDSSYSNRSSESSRDDGGETTGLPPSSNFPDDITPDAAVSRQNESESNEIPEIRPPKSAASSQQLDDDAQWQSAVPSGKSPFPALHACMHDVSKKMFGNFCFRHPGIVGGTPTDASALMAAYRLLSSVACSNDDNDRPVHSLMLSLGDLRGLTLRRRLQSTVRCSMIFGSVS